MFSNIGFLELVIIGLLLLLNVFWIWMIIDCAIKEPPNNNKIVWILVIVIAQCVGAAIYFFVRRPQRIREIGR